KMKKHHKIIIGSTTSLILILLIMNSVFIYILFSKLQYDYNQLSSGITNLEKEINTKLNEITTSIIETKEDVIKLNEEIGSIDAQFSELDQEFTKLKATTSSDFSGIIEDAVKSVVTIKTDISQGTGFIINEEGYLVTNYHVIEGARAAGVYTYEGTQHKVSLIGSNKDQDLALLKIDGNFQRLKLTNSENIQIGQKVIAIGNPLGLQFSVSEGIVSAVHRPGPNGLEAYIQTDAALNPGNSGGPLINKEGEVIGINNFKIGSGESLGFALESNYVIDFVNEIYSQTQETPQSLI
ncbi:trypsin-like peptidase domain-containing protein, partial [Candidatus Pacearchaeota archaeon]|nr:trypsin-like peptidase domain-containing protein [Candidatus Pacearchaeota archaeon]